MFKKSSKSRTIRPRVINYSDEEDDNGSPKVAPQTAFNNQIEIDQIPLPVDIQSNEYVKPCSSKQIDVSTTLPPVKLSFYNDDDNKDSESFEVKKTKRSLRLAKRLRGEKNRIKLDELRRRQESEEKLDEQNIQDENASESPESEIEVDDEEDVEVIEITNEKQKPEASSELNELGDSDSSDEERNRWEKEKIIQGLQSTSISNVYQNLSTKSQTSFRPGRKNSTITINDSRNYVKGQIMSMKDSIYKYNEKIAHADSIIRKVEHRVKDLVKNNESLKALQKIYEEMFCCAEDKDIATIVAKEEKLLKGAPKNQQELLQRLRIVLEERLSEVNEDVPQETS